MTSAKPRGKAVHAGQALVYRDLRQSYDDPTATTKLVGEINRDLTLKAIATLQPISRAHLARVSGLQPSTGSRIGEQLLREGWVREGARIDLARGRPPVMLSLNDDLVVIAADVQPKQIVVALLDLRGRLLERVVSPCSSDPERALLTMVAVMGTFRERHAEKTFMGIGVSMPGRIDPKTNRLVFSPSLPWCTFDLAGCLHT